MKPFLSRRAVTLIELLLALVLFVVMAVGIFSIDSFGRYNILTMDRRIRIQHQASDIIEHMSKKVVNTISRPVRMDATSIRFYIDQDLDGTSSSGDAWVAYRYRNGTAPSGQRYRVEYCSNYNTTSSGCNVDWAVVGKNILIFTAAIEPSDTYLTVNITGCWDPSEPDKTYKHCGTADNPGVNMTSRFNLPSTTQ